MSSAEGSPQSSERTLILLRHGKSDWSGHETDRLRPLAARGRRQAPEAGRWLAAHLDGIDLAVASPARRARDTWDLVAAELDVPPPIQLDDRVYGASAPELLDIVRELSDEIDTAALVGHNPGIEDFAALLTGEGPAMPTSALAVVTIAGSWSNAAPHSATLRASGRPPAD